MSAPTWAEPPPIGGPQDPRSYWMERLRPLVEHPGRWAVIKSGLPSTINQAANMMRTRQVHIPPGEWEFTVRTFRRGVHVGDMSACQLYARFVREWEEGEGFKPYPWSKDKMFNDAGERVCPDCGTPLRVPEGSGKWDDRCDDCWQKLAETNVDVRKYLKKRARFRRDGYPKPNRTPQCVPCGFDDRKTVATTKRSDLNFCAEHAAEWDAYDREEDAS